MTHPLRSALAVSILGLILAGSPAAGAEQPLAGSQVVAKASGDAVVIWDATNWIVQLAPQHIPNPKLLARIKSESGAILLKKAGGLSAAKTLTVKVVYARIGAISKQYNNASFADFERLVSLKAKRSDALKNAAAWGKQFAAGKMPAGVKVTVTGRLPDR